MLPFYVRLLTSSGLLSFVGVIVDGTCRLDVPVLSIITSFVAGDSFKVLLMLRKDSICMGIRLSICAFKQALLTVSSTILKVKKATFLLMGYIIALDI